MRDPKILADDLAQLFVVGPNRAERARRTPRPGKPHAWIAPISRSIGVGGWLRRRVAIDLGERSAQRSISFDSITRTGSAASSGDLSPRSRAAVTSLSVISLSGHNREHAIDDFRCCRTAHHETRRSSATIQQSTISVRKIFVPS